jgi:hypothetical protein
MGGGINMNYGVVNVSTHEVNVGNACDSCGGGG